MKTEGLRQALDEHKFDVALGGARRDEEKSRAKERIFSFRSKFHGWDPKSQRPELFNNFNCKINKSESMRVFHFQIGQSLMFGNILKKKI